MYDGVNIMFKNISAIDISNITQEEKIEKLSKLIEEQEFIKYKEIPLDLEQELSGEEIDITIYYKIGIPKNYFVYPSGRIQLSRNNKNLYISESKVDIELIKELLFCE